MTVLRKLGYAAYISCLTILYMLLIGMLFGCTSVREYERRELDNLPMYEKLYHTPRYKIVPRNVG